MYKSSMKSMQKQHFFYFLCIESFTILNIKMKLILVTFICLFGLSYANPSKDLIQSFNAGPECDLKPNDENGVICVSKTHFYLSFQDPIRDVPLKCPNGTVCADVPEICSSSVSPLCYNEVPGSKGVCNMCSPTLNSPVCISKTQFTFCANGKLMPSMTYSCPAVTPNCKASINSAGALTGICTAFTTELDCPN